MKYKGKSSILYSPKSEFLSNKDAQSDMLCAFIGSLAAVILLSRYHDSKMKKIEGR